jgi:hypothetical protein
MPKVFILLCALNIRIPITQNATSKALLLVNGKTKVKEYTIFPVAPNIPLSGSKNIGVKTGFALKPRLKPPGITGLPVAPNNCYNPNYRS